MKESRLADPFLFFDQFGMHHGDLAGRPAKTPGQCFRELLI
jgi:hypothetical protein